MEVANMLKFKLGLLLGFGAGWAVGSGRAADFWSQVQERASNRSNRFDPVGARQNENGTAFTERTSVRA
jgi:hypothetical protein